MDAMTRLRLKRLTRAVYDSSDVDPDEPTHQPRFLPGAGTVLALVLVVVVITAATLWRTNAGGSPSQQPASVAETGEDGAQSAAPRDPTTGEEPISAGPVTAAENHVVVHVVGRVAEPGVYSLPEGSRVIDAVEAAGGAHEDANLEGVNLARLLVDGEQIDIPGPGEASSGAIGESDSSAGGSCVDLNTATTAELEELDGVGPALAKRIASYREQVGSIASVDQLDAVPGIGASTLDKIRTGTCQ